jgi:branched-chain amino acid transport system substrate-binding protein
MFAAGYTGAASGAAMANFALSKPGVKKIALVAHSNDWAAGYCAPATEAIKAAGAEIAVSTAMERGSTDATAQSLQIKQSGAQAVMGCLYQQELVILLRDMAKYGVDAIVLGALGADFNQTVQQVGNPAAVKGKFFQPYQFQAKIGTGPLKAAHDVFTKYLTKDELPKSGPPTNFYYFGAPIGVVTVEAFKRAGPKPTRESWIAAVESLKDFQTGIFADTETFSKDNHVGVRKMFAVGLNDAGEETVYTAFGKPLPSGS